MSSERVLRSCTLFAIGLVMVGAMFKIMHWAGGAVLIIVAIAALITVQLISIFRSKSFDALKVLRSLAVVAWGFRLLFRVTLFIKILCYAVIAAWAIMEIISFFRRGGNSSRSNKLYVLGGVLVLAGIACQLLYWPGGPALMLAGILVLGLVYIKDI